MNIFSRKAMNENRRIKQGPALKAFTLIEILLVVSLISMVGLAVYQSISNGLKIWKRSDRFVLEEDIAIFLDKFNEDLANAFDYSLIFFEGEDDRVSFPTIVWTAADKKITQGATDYVYQIGKVEYSFDRMKKTLVRKQFNFSQAVEGKSGQERIMAAPIHSVQFLYYYLEGENQEGIQKTAKLLQKVETLPLAVEVKIIFEEDTGGKREITRLINIPRGNFKNESVPTSSI